MLRELRRTHTSSMPPESHIRKTMPRNIKNAPVILLRELRRNSYKEKENEDDGNESDAIERREEIELSGTMHADTSIHLSRTERRTSILLERVACI